MRAVLDRAGRIVLPKRLRAELHLEAGDVLEIETTGDEITLRPVRERLQLRRKRGIWMCRAGEALSANAVERVVHQIRRERITRNLGQ